MPDRFLEGAGETKDVVEVNDNPKPFGSQVPDHWGQHLCGDPRGRGQAKGHGQALVLHSFPHEPHEPAVRLVEAEVEVEVREVDLGHVVVLAEHLR